MRSMTGEKTHGELCRNDDQGDEYPDSNSMQHNGLLGSF